MFRSSSRYVPPIKPGSACLSLDVIESSETIEEEIRKQESLLNQLHAELNAGRVNRRKEEQLWEVQRVITQLKVCLAVLYAFRIV